MVMARPAQAPEALFDAFAYIGAVETPTLDDLRLMVILEAAGKALYECMAEGVAHPGARQLLLDNGREELAHAHRVQKALRALTGEDFTVPVPAENPYLQAPLPAMAVNREVLLNLAETEDNGENLYARWADAIGNEQAAALFRQNGKEELDHANRLREAAALL